MNTLEPKAMRSRLDAIVIGGSAGAVDGLGMLLPQLPAGFPLPLLVVVHLRRDRPSLLTEIFAKQCALRVCEAEDKAPVEGATVYFAPPDYHMLVDVGRCLALSGDAMVHYSRPSIDVLFESAADEYGDRLMGILLSGANRDGAEGLARIHRAGGLTVVQTPQTAVAGEMGRAALELADAHQVLALDEIAALLRGLGTA